MIAPNVRIRRITPRVPGNRPRAYQVTVDSGLGTTMDAHLFVRGLEPEVRLIQTIYHDDLRQSQTDELVTRRVAAAWLRAWLYERNCHQGGQS